MKTAATPRFLTHRDTAALLDELARVVQDDDAPLAAGAGVTGALVAAMERAGIHPVLVYAFRVTGMLVSEDNQDLWTRAELELWSGALARYRPGVPVDEVVPPSGRVAAFLASSSSTAC
jgi:hypothetical protein